MNENDNENAQAEYVEGGSEERQELSYADAFQLATQLHRAQQYEQAQSLYRALIELEPADPNPQHFLGILLHQIGQSDEGIALIESSLQHDSAVGSWHNNHGNVLLDRRQVDLAADAYARCIAAEPANLEVLNNLAVVERHRGNFDEAVALFRKALEVEPTFLDARHNLASLYFARGATKEAMAESAIAMEQHPKSDKTRLLLGLVYGRLGQLDNAIRVFQDWLRDEPNSPQARHYLAACSGEAVPERAGTEYVEDLFDGFASSFDAKLESLNYCAPTLIADALAELDSSPVTRPTCRSKAGTSTSSGVRTHGVTSPTKPFATATS